MKKFTTSRLTAAAVVLAGAFQIQACGGDDGDSSSSPSTSMTPSTGGTSTSSGTGGSAAGGSSTASGGSTSSGGSSATIPAGKAVDTAIPTGSVDIDGPGQGVDTDAGFDGYFWTNVDGGGSTLQPREFKNISSAELTENKICINGEVAKVVDNDWGGTWGAEVGWNILSEAATIDHTDGIKFTIEQATASPIRFQIKAADETLYCFEAKAGENTIMWDELKTDCWGTEGDDFDVAATKVTDLIWKVPSTDSSTVPYDFCVGGMTIITDGGMGGAGGGTN